MADVFPVVKGEPVPMEQIRSDPGEAGIKTSQVQELDRRREALKVELSGLVMRHRQISARYRRLIKDSESRKMTDATMPLFDEIEQRFGPWDPAVRTWIENTRAEMLEHLEHFREGERHDKDAPPPFGPRFEDFLSMMQVNLLWDPGKADEGPAACPVVEENFPTWRNLFGSIEASGEPPTASFLDIKSGSLLRACGGYILLSARDVLTEPRVYDHLKRVLRRGLLEIAPREDGHGVQYGIKPAPIPLDVKVVLIGEPAVYEMLHATDPDFPKIFKVKVEFDESMPLTPDSMGRFLSVLKRIITENRLPPFEREALEVAIEEGVRLTGTRTRLTTQFSDVADVMREAAHLAGRRNSGRVAARDMKASLDLRRRRHGLAERRFLDLLREGKLLVEVDGGRVGQVNGLGFYDLDYVQFAMPARISATCSTGRTGVVNIEREAQLSGSIHDKGVLILSGFLASTFAQNKPLSLHANIAFEQSYATVDGDSASLAELLALLSALSRIPLRQDLAVTGSLSQRGGVQPVGGVTEKTDGFFRACRILGLTGRQGVVLPAQNIPDLHLSTDTCVAIRRRQFHVYPVSDYTEALELLTGRKPQDVLAASDKTLAAYAAVVRDYR
jgi:lon-related putative ATP-dependent protease